MRSDEEILERITVEKRNDPLGLSISDLVVCLPFDVASSNGFVKEGATREEWDKYVSSRDPEDVKKEITEYLEFAWDKAIGHRGISAIRSIGHIRNWVWLTGDDEALKFVEDEWNYPQYGVPVLKYVSERFGYEWPKDEYTERMARGEVCGRYEGCGCGK
jgi:hypothetical protein